MLLDCPLDQERLGRYTGISTRSQRRLSGKFGHEMGGDRCRGRWIMCYLLIAYIVHCKIDNNNFCDTYRLCLNCTYCFALWQPTILGFVSSVCCACVLKIIL